MLDALTHRFTSLATAGAVALAGGLFTAGSASAAFYETGFEDPPIPVGDLENVDGWYSARSGPNQVFEGGVGGVPAAPEGTQVAQILEYDDNGNRMRFSSRLEFHDDDGGLNPITENYQVSFLIYADEIHTGSRSGVWLYGGDAGWVGWGLRESGGNLQFLWASNTGGSSNQVGTTNALFDTWYRYDIDLDPTSGTFDIVISDHATNMVVETDSGVFGAGYHTIVALESGGTSVVGTGTQTVLYVDDLSVIPEPASLALIGLGGLLMLRRGRKQA